MKLDDGMYRLEEKYPGYEDLSAELMGVVNRSGVGGVAVMFAAFNVLTNVLAAVERDRLKFAARDMRGILEEIIENAISGKTSQFERRGPGAGH